MKHKKMKWMLMLPIILFLLELQAGKVPENVTVNTATTTSLAVKWDDPNGDTSHYLLNCTCEDEGCSEDRKQIDDATTGLCTGLTPGTEYEVKVTAVVNGTQYSAEPEDTLTKVAKPTDVTIADPTIDSFTVSWQLEGGSVVLNVTCGDSYGEVDAANMTAVCSGLTPGSKYDVTVTAAIGEDINPSVPIPGYTAGTTSSTAVTTTTMEPTTSSTTEETTASPTSATPGGTGAPSGSTTTGTTAAQKTPGTTAATEATTAAPTAGTPSVPTTSSGAVTTELHAGECIPTKYADVLVVIDTATNIDSVELIDEIEFVEHLMAQFDIGPSKTQVAAMNFDDSAQLWFNLSTHQRYSDIMDAIAKEGTRLLSRVKLYNNMIDDHFAANWTWGEFRPYIYTFYAGSFEVEFFHFDSLYKKVLEMMKIVFKVENGMRKDALQMVIVIIDATTVDNFDNSPYNTENITLFYSIGVGTFGKNQTVHNKTEQIAISPENVIKLEYFSDLKSITAALVKKMCAIVVPCASIPCQHEAACTNDQNMTVYECVCKPGSTGINCETDIPECVSEPCLNGGTCMDEANHYICECLPGFTGTNCETDVDECASCPCQNGGTCEDLVNNFTCSCLPGFSGIFCQYEDECYSRPCQNGGTCRDGNNTYACLCLRGVTGTHCETQLKVCTNENCIHGDCGTMYRCSCNMGYTGAHCESALCSETLCDECNDDMIRCDTCNAAFTGTNCETELCNPSQCLNGKCSSDFYTCECDKDYTGPQCKEKPLRVRIEGYDKPLKEGDQLALQCIPNDEEQEFSFFWGFTPVGGEVDYISFDQNLIIEDVTKDNAGNYGCSIYYAMDYIDVEVNSNDGENMVTVSVTPAPLISIKDVPIIGIALVSIFCLMVISAVSVILWKRRERQRIAEENALQDESSDDYSTFSDSDKIALAPMK